jgi:ARC6-like, IMS domain
MSLTNQEPVLVEKLNNKVMLLYENNQKMSGVSGFFGIEEFNAILEEYVQMRRDFRIPNILRYTILSSIAKQYKLYENNQEPNQLSRLVIAEIESLMVGNQTGQVTSENLIVGLQIVKSKYPLLNRENEQGLLSIEQALLEAIANNPSSQPQIKVTYYPESRLPTYPLNQVTENNFDFVPMQTKQQAQIAKKTAIIPRENLWVASLLMFCLIGGVLSSILISSRDTKPIYVSGGNTEIGKSEEKRDSTHKNNSKSSNPVSTPISVPSSQKIPLPKTLNNELLNTVKPTNSSGIASTQISTVSSSSKSQEMRRNEESTINEDSGNELVSTSSSLSISANISQEESLNVVKRFLESKQQMFAPPYNQNIGYEIMTGKAYRDNIKGPSSDGTGESSIDWLRNNGFYYHYGIQKIQSIMSFKAAGNNAVIVVNLLEEANLYNKKGVLYKSKSGTEEKIIRYSLSKENEIVKISDYITIGQSKRKI